MISFKNFIAENKPKGKDVLPDEPGHQTPGYYQGIKKKDKVARARHFARQGKMSDSDPSAYKNAPGDSEGQHGNKKSKHTLKVMKMYPSLYKNKKKTNESIQEDKAGKSLADKSKASGIPVGILRSVYNRGMAAWKGGHRKGMAQQQWAHARVNSFIGKGSGTWGKADKDLAAKARASKKSRKENYNEGSESWKAGYTRRVVKTSKPEHKEKGYNWRIKGKDRPEISIKLYKEKPSQSEFNKQMKRVAGHEFGG
jgi:hypothetical protein